MASEITLETPIRQLGTDEKKEAVRMARDQLELALTAGRFLVSFHRVVGDQLHHDWTMFDFPDGDMKNCVAALRDGCARSLREKAVSVMGQKTNVETVEVIRERAEFQAKQFRLAHPTDDDEECSESVPSAGGQPPPPPEMLRLPLGDIDEAT